MIFWQHNDDFSKPPELEDLRYRRPDGKYWESRASEKHEALHNLWGRWKRETGKEFPRQIPSVPEIKRHGIVNRIQANRRPERQK